MEYVTTLSHNEPIAITIGNFDGIHKGHQRLLHRLSAMAQELHCKPVLVTFEPHTLMVLKPEIDLRYLTTLEEKLALAKRCAGIADTIVIRFTPQVTAMSAEEFMDHLYAHFTIKGMVVGANFSLGHNRMGDVAFLQSYGQQHAIDVYAIPLEEIKRSRISSTRIRTLVSKGEVIEASDLLGHPVTASGIVVHGDHRGRQLGFPTANLVPDAHKLLPADGVYAARVSIEQDPAASDSSSSSRVYNSAVNIGVRPTFQGHTRLVEAYLLDVDLDLYEKRITLDFIERLRGEQRFPGIEALKAQLTHDVQQARQILQ